MARVQGRAPGRRWAQCLGSRPESRSRSPITLRSFGAIDGLARSAAAENGAIILPPVPGFYSLPATVQDIVDQSVGRALDLFDIETDLVKRWGEEQAGKQPRSSAHCVS